ncbi:MAG TPA: hypothetical protein HA341_02485 [Halobacteria archaeon]|jgi:phosphatidylglycerophosphate synthase|nr:hypothetical protein [Halobacteria archaeon]HIH77780.1 hypothetical protein [Halobacteria archaeon]
MNGSIDLPLLFAVLLMTFFIAAIIIVTLINYLKDKEGFKERVGASSMDFWLLFSLLIAIFFILLSLSIFMIYT